MLITKSGELPTHILIFIIVFLTIESERPLFAQGRSEVIAMTGTNISGTNDTFESVDTLPVLNNNSKIAFLATINGGSEQGIYLFDGNSVVEIARSSDSIPNGNGSYESFSDRVQLNDVAKLAFVADFTGPGNSDTGIFFADTVQTNEVVRQGESAPGGNGTFPEYPNNQYPFSLNQVGEVVFYAELENTNLGNVDSHAIYRGSGNGGTPQEIVRDMDIAPNGGFIFFPIHPTVNQFGGVAYRSQVSAGIPAVFFVQGATTFTIAGEGDLAPGGLGTYDNILVNNLNPLSSPNSSGDVAFIADTNLINGAIFLEGFSQSEVVAFPTQLEPNGNGLFSTLFTPFLNGSGNVAFRARLIGTDGLGDDDSGIFTWKNGLLRSIVREGDTIPDGSFQLSELSNATLQTAFSESNVVMFESFLQSESGNSFGIFIANENDWLQVSRTGQDLEGMTILSPNAVSIPGRPNGNALNDFGQVAYSANLSGGAGSAIILYTPEIYWTNSSTGNWGDSENWTLGMVPGTPHDVFIRPTANLTVNGPTEIEGSLVRNLQIGGEVVQGGVTLDLQNGFELNAIEHLLVRQFGRIIGGGIVAAEEIRVEPDGELISTNLTLSAETLFNEGLLQSNQMLTIFGDLVNDGEVVVNGNGAQDLDVFGDFVNGGDLILNPGSLTRVTGEYRGNGGTSIAGPGEISFEGILNPDNQHDCGGCIASLGPSAQFDIELRSNSSFDAIVNVANLNLDGNLNISLGNSFTLSGGLEFMICEINDLRNGQFNGLDEGDIVATLGGVDLLISYTAGNGNDVALYTEIEQVLLGDVNLDGVVNLLDVQPFVSLIATGGFQLEADINKDGFVNLLDVSPFVQLLIG